MIRYLVVVFLTVLGGLFLWTGAVVAQRGSQTQEIRSDQLDSGGNHRQSARWMVRDSIGPLPQGVGRRVSDSFESQAGFFYMAVEILPGDFDENGRLDFGDLLLLSRSWKTEKGQPNFRFTADLFQEADRQRIDERDLLAWLRLYRQRSREN
jgi:hypothetical protein